MQFSEHPNEGTYFLIPFENKESGFERLNFMFKVMTLSIGARPSDSRTHVLSLMITKKNTSAPAQK